MDNVSSLFLDLKLTICLSLCRNLESVLSLLRFHAALRFALNDKEIVFEIKLSPTKPNYGHFHPNDYRVKYF